MGAVGGLLGLNGGAGGSGFNPQSGTNAGQLNDLYHSNAAAMGQQQNLLSALQGQNGIQNQSNVYGQLQNVVQGQGPNPAQAQLAQATGANVANQAALMAGQRGAGANAGLMARQAAQTGAGLQQQAAGQGATMQAQQSLNALGQAGEMAGNMAANQIGQTNANTAAQQNEQSILQGANTANNQVQGQLANTTMQNQQKTLGGIGNAIGAATHFFAQGGVAGGNAFGPKSMFGNFVNQPQPTVQPFSTPVPDEPDQKKKPMAPSSPMDGAKTMSPSTGQGLSHSNMAAHGGMVKAMVSPEEIILTPEEAKMVAEGRAKASQVGEKVPGKAPVKGDSYTNDVVPKKLPVGGVVVPKSKLETKNPDRNSAAFVRDVMAKKRAKA